VVDIVALDKQADGGTHVRSTGEVGGIRVLETESKGKGNKRVRVEVVDAQVASYTGTSERQFWNSARSGTG
jgi:misacylated tRNA(Ala) deacylase